MQERNIYYVVQVEVFLSKVFSDGEDTPDKLTFDGAVPPRFYGEMAKTDLQLPLDFGRVTHLLHTIFLFTKSDYPLVFAPNVSRL